ncbi:polymerase [Spirochaetia bacterium]|nr:polymerase [Spirochaetia bacterium]GHV19292.1 polymerase [Spirochaetia bacterium]
MVDFARLQAAVKELLEEDLAIQSIEAEGSTLEAAVSEAATLLAVPVRYLEYEILENQSSFLGLGKDFCKIRAYENPLHKKKKSKEKFAEEELGEGSEEVEIIQDRDGGVFVQIRNDGVYLKAVPPLGKGRKASNEDAYFLLAHRNVSDYDKKSVDEIVRKPRSKYIQIGVCKHITINDSIVDVEIADQEMSAYIKVSKPGPGGIDLTCEEYVKILNNNGVTYGISEEKLNNFADSPIYNEKICVAEGKNPVDGDNSFIEYLFETDQNKVRIKESTDGKVDFKELNIIQNVFEGEKLAVIHPAQLGELGFTVTGRSIATRDGKDFPVALGKNVHLTDDGLTIIADINGQVVMANAKINVESVYTIDGAVNLKTGNIIFLGNVVVTGNVEEGFSVKASGNIEVHGTVDKASLDSEGDIIVRQGITGKEGTLVSAGRSVWAKFIENSKVRTGDMVIVSDGIINSYVDAGKRILLQGKRAAVIGGRLRAAEEISAKSLGSLNGNTETVCEVGYDPKSKSELESLFANRTALSAALEDVNINFQTLSNIKLQRKTLPEEKEKYLEELIEKKAAMTKELAELNDKISKLSAFISELANIGRISASAKVHPGVIIVIRDVREAVRNDYKAVTFVLEDGIVKAEKYMEPNVSAAQRTE